MTFGLNPTKCNCSTSRNSLLLFKHPSIDSQPHPAKRSITENFFKFRSSFMCAVAILKSFIINYIYNILRRTAHTIRYCKNTKKPIIKKKKLHFFDRIDSKSKCNCSCECRKNPRCKHPNLCGGEKSHGAIHPNHYFL